MPLIQWIMGLDKQSVIGSGGVAVGGEAVCRLLATNHVGSGGGVGGGTSQFQFTYNPLSHGGGVGGGSAVVQFVPNPNRKFFTKKIHWMPGDIVYDPNNRKFVVEETYVNREGEHQFCSGGRVEFYTYELHDRPYIGDVEWAIEYSGGGVVIPGHRTVLSSDDQPELYERMRYGEGRKMLKIEREEFAPAREADFRSRFARVQKPFNAKAFPGRRVVSV